MEGSVASSIHAIAQQELSLVTNLFALFAQRDVFELGFLLLLLIFALDLHQGDSLARATVRGQPEEAQLALWASILRLGPPLRALMMEDVSAVIQHAYLCIGLDGKQAGSTDHLPTATPRKGWTSLREYVSFNDALGPRPACRKLSLLGRHTTRRQQQGQRGAKDR